MWSHPFYHDKNETHFLNLNLCQESDNFPPPHPNVLSRCYLQMHAGFKKHSPGPWREKCYLSTWQFYYLPVLHIPLLQHKNFCGSETPLTCH